MDAVRVPWSHASFLVYLGGITILAAVLAFLSIESSEHGASRLVGWSALASAILAALAFLSKRNGRLVTAGLYALSAVAAFIVFFGALLSWFGWLAAVALRIFRFPLLVLVIAASAWFFVTDLVSGGGDWSAIVTIAYGLSLLAVAVASDSSEPRTNGFWLHVVAGLTIGGGLLWFFHEGDWDWVVIGVAALAYILLGDRLLRSSWVVLAAWGLLQVTTHFAGKWAAITAFTYFPLGLVLFPFLGFGGFNQSHDRPWRAALSYAILGLVFIAIAQLLARRRREAIPGAELL